MELFRNEVPKVLLSKWFEYLRSKLIGKSAITASCKKKEKKRKKRGWAVVADCGRGKL